MLLNYGAKSIVEFLENRLTMLLSSCFYIFPIVITIELHENLYISMKSIFNEKLINVYSFMSQKNIETKIIMTIINALSGTKKFIMQTIKLAILIPATY